MAKETAALKALAALPADEAGSPGGLEVIREALSSNAQELIVSAAKVIAKHRLPGLEGALSESYRSLKRDPGCLAREALLLAMEATESNDAALFADAAVFAQLEKSKRDTAARVREQAVLSLARVGHPEQLILFGAALGDVNGNVRLAGARAVAHSGLRDGAGLLLLRSGAGDPEPEVAMECLRGLFVIAPDHAVRRARELLASDNESLREQTLHALGTAADDRAIELLAGELRGLSIAHERSLVIESLALSLRPAARELLLGLIGEDRGSDAEAALAALAVHRYDTRLVDRLRESTAGSSELSARFRELYEA
jgi:HEAT repeat protein